MAKKKNTRKGKGDNLDNQSMMSLVGLPEPVPAIKISGPGGVPLDALGNPISQNGDYEIETGEDYDFNARDLEDRSLDHGLETTYERRRAGMTGTGTEPDYEFPEDVGFERNSHLDYGYDPLDDDILDYEDTLAAEAEDETAWDEEGFDGLSAGQIDSLYESLNEGISASSVMKIVRYAKENGYAALGNLFYDGVMDGGIDMFPDMARHLNFIYALTKIRMKPAGQYM